MYLSVEHRDKADVISIHGNLDAITTPRLGDQISENLSSKPQLVLDFAEVSYISSAGLRTLLAGLKQARAAGGDLRLAAVQSSVHKVFEMSGFTTILTIYDGVDEAVASFNA